MSKHFVTTIKPASELYVSFKPRSKEGMPEKPEVFAAIDYPAAIANIANPDLAAFAKRAWHFAVLDSLKDAVKEGKQEFTLSMETCFAEAKREFLITKKDLEAWIDNFALPIISAALAAKAGLHIDSPKVVKKAIAYKELLLLISSRSIMMQDQIDSCLKVAALITETGKEHPYSDNVWTGIARKQEKLNAYLAGKDDEDDDFDL